MNKPTLPVTVAAIILSSAAFAQTSAWIEIEDEKANVDQFGMTVDALEDMALFNAGGESIGEIEEVLGTSDGQATAFSAEVGGFLDIGDTEVIIPFEAVTLNNENKLQVNMSKEDIEALERLED